MAPLRRSVVEVIRSSLFPAQSLFIYVQRSPPTLYRVHDYPGGGSVEALQYSDFFSLFTKARSPTLNLALRCRSSLVMIDGQYVKAGSIR